MSLRSLLMVAPDAFHLGWMGATRRLFHLAEAFRALGYETVLLAGRATVPALQKEIDSEFPGRVLRSRHSGDYPWIFDHFKNSRRIWRITWKARGQEIYGSKLSWGWADKLREGWLLKCLARFGVTPSLVWGVSAGYLAGAMTARRISRLLEIPWVLELHDPPRGVGFGPDKNRVRNGFEELLAEANSIVVTANSYKAKLVKDFDVSPSRIDTVHLSYEGGVSDNIPVENGHFTIAYLGSLDGGRSLRPLLEALKRAARTERSFVRTGRLVLAGKGLGFDDAKKFIADDMVELKIEMLGQISADQASVVLRESSVSVIIQPEQSANQVPGKLFENLKNGRPILGIMPAQCEAAAILRHSGLGFIHENDDVNGICNSVLSMWRMWRDGQSLSVPNPDFIKQFSLDRLPAKLKPSLVKATQSLGSLDTTNDVVTSKGDADNAS